MKKWLLLSLIGVFALCGCSGKAQSSVQNGGQEMTEEEEDISFFPMKADAFIGDTMPFYEDGKMNIFYLADQRDNKTGYHPWALMQTEDFCTYEDMGIVIPYGTDMNDQDLALGTGSVIKGNDGLYHAFYTGHSDVRSPKEAIMHATSTDLLNWTKIPGDTFIANENYSIDDFRDPYVFYVEEEQCYWMLIVTRYQKNGVIAKYTSKDLSKWSDGGVLFTDDMGYGANLECPTLLKYNGYWYLSFSDQWPHKLVHYRVSDSINGPFTKLDKDTFDGNGFYAGRMETDGENLYVVGWNPTKDGHDDENEYNWAGSMVTHQLKQLEDGTLVPVVNESILKRVNKGKPATVVAMTDTISSKKNTFEFAGDQFEFVQFESIPGYYRIEMDVKNIGADAKFGLGFAVGFDHVGGLNMMLDAGANTASFYNTTKLFTMDPQSSVDFDFAGKESIHLTLLGTDGVMTLYINDEVALTSRMYRSQMNEWEIFAVNSDVTFENVEIFN